MWAPSLSLAEAQAGKAGSALELPCSPLSTCGTILKHQFIQDMDSFFRIPNMQLGIYREIKNPHVYLLGWHDTSLIGFDLLERSFKTQRKFQNSKSGILSVTLSLVRTNLTPEHPDHKSHPEHSWVLVILYLPKTHLQSSSLFSPLQSCVISVLGFLEHHLGPDATVAGFSRRTLTQEMDTFFCFLLLKMGRIGKITLHSGSTSKSRRGGTQ